MSEHHASRPREHLEETVYVNHERFLTRVAIRRAKRIEYLFAEPAETTSNVGNIYKGRIINVLKGLNAAFVDIGEERNGFLPFEEPDDIYVSEDVEDGGTFPDGNIPQYRTGEEVMIQITKPGSALKGVKLTTQVSIPGRHFVLLPFSTKKGVSRRIESRAERQRLLKIFESAMPPTMGCIVRTACENKDEKHIRHEVKFMVGLWSKVKRKAARAQAPTLLWEELDLARTVLRDYAGPRIHSVVVDDDSLVKQLRSYARLFAPELLPKIAHHRERAGILKHYGLEDEIEGFLRERVPLPSGGYLLVEEGETLNSIDINTGGSARRNVDETIFNTNIEAAREIPRQIRIRNLSGLIVIDFIDMRNESQRRRVYSTLDSYMEEDKARTKTLSISRLGLVEMSREKFGLSLRRTLLEECECCGGTGRMRSLPLVALDLKNQLAVKMKEAPSRRFIIQLSPELHDFVRANDVLRLRFFERRRVNLRPENGRPKQYFEILEQE